MSEQNTQLDRAISELARAYLPDAVALLKEVIRIPADYVDRPPCDGGDPLCGLSNHEGPRLEVLREAIIRLGAVERPEDVGFDGFGNLVWTVQDRTDGVPPAEKTVVYLDGHSDTVKALRTRWLEAIGGGIDAYDGATGKGSIDYEFLRSELGHLPPEDQWEHLVFGRGAADQLGGVVCQVMATRIALALRAEGALRGVIIRSYATVAEEDNDGGGPMYLMRHTLPGAPPDLVPDVIILTEGTGCANQGAIGIYRGQRGRMQIEVRVTGRSCHGSMPWEGENPLEYGGAIIAAAAEQYRRRDGFLDHDFLGHGTRTASFATLETPSDCAVPERFTFRFDRRLTVGETPEQAVADVERLDAVANAREDGLEVDISIPVYEEPTWRGFALGNQQVYPGWITPEDHPAVTAALESYGRVSSPLVDIDAPGGGTKKTARLARWIFSTDGVGFPLPLDDRSVEVPPRKRWVESGAFKHPAMFGIGPGVEQNTHKIGENVDARELAPVMALYARFPTLYRALVAASEG